MVIYMFIFIYVFLKLAIGYSCGIIFSPETLALLFEIRDKRCKNGMEHSNLNLNPSFDLWRD